MSETEDSRSEEQESQEPSFRKVDKRHSAQEASEQEETTEKGAAEDVEEVTAEESSEPEGVPMAALDVHDTLRFTVELLAQQAWIEMGLQLAPGAQEPKKDLAQARMAIDVLEFIVAKLEPVVEDEERSELNSLLANLRINYVKKV